ncbi:hypothetical protein GPJ56_004978 [Histomonas meleagridis]|uniref:uncharacterized protein n=1 Tax=Histomonas meleagridis TaxID=135588 RepID=UPI0035596D3B|nr:hypothetical protein GPJ56_004978 [Histomonas meleagridis]KAH0798496.1 hypothetical protein GO595_008361 [Histomonas meleagridis]
MSEKKGAEALMKMAQANMNKKKKDKGKSKANKNKKSQDALNQFLNSSTPQTGPRRTTSTEFNSHESRPKIVKSNRVLGILATTGNTQIEESDVKRIFSDLNLKSVETFPGYFIIEFQDKGDLLAALKKNKTTYRNNITILIGEYSEADEYPVPRQHDDDYGYNRSDNRRDNYSRDNYSRDNYRDNYSRDSYGRKPFGFQPKQEISFTFGTKTQASIPQEKTQEENKGGKYIPPHKK